MDDLWIEFVQKQISKLERVLFSQQIDLCDLITNSFIETKKFDYVKDMVFKESAGDHIFFKVGSKRNIEDFSEVMKEKLLKESVIDSETRFICFELSSKIKYHLKENIEDILDYLDEEEKEELFDDYNLYLKRTLENELTKSEDFSGDYHRYTDINSRYSNEHDFDYEKFKANIKSDALLDLSNDFFKRYDDMVFDIKITVEEIKNNFSSICL